MTQNAISCELHDFVEVACMYNYQLKLLLKNTQIIEGKALDIINSADKKECLVLETNGEKQKIELTQLTKMEVITPNAKFKEIIF